MSKFLFLKIFSHLISLNAMKHLQSNGRCSVVYGLSKTVGTLREDGSDSLLPSKRVIMGLIDYSINFFNSDSGGNVRKTSNPFHALCIIPCHRFDIVFGIST